MTFNTGTATDYLDLFDQLIQVVTSRHMATVAVNAGGTNYIVGEILNISGTGATSTHVAQIEVVTVSTGVITAARIFQGGAYTVDPTTITANVSTSTSTTYDGVSTPTPGTGATFDLTFAATGWTLITRQEKAASAVVSAGGTGYTNGSTDVLTLVGGVLAVGGSAATFTATVSGGIVTSVALLTAGDYEVFPTNAVLTTVAPAGGTGCTLTVTTANVTGDRIAILQGDAGAALDPLVGIKTYTVVNGDQTGANDIFNWALFGMTSHTTSSSLQDQANLSPGLNGSGLITTSASGDGSFMPLSSALTINWTIRANARNVEIIAHVPTATQDHYAHAAFGHTNVIGITTEFPFPAFIAGSSDRPKVWNGDSISIFGGLSEVISRNNGPCFVWSPEGAWIEMKSSVITSNTDTTPAEGSASRARTSVWPLSGSQIHATVDDRIWEIAGTNEFDNGDLALTSGATVIKRTPDTGGDLFPLFPITYTQSDSTSGFHRVFGELDGVFWLHDAGAGISSDDRITQGGVAYRIFQNGTQVQPFSFLALRED